MTGSVRLFCAVLLAALAMPTAAQRIQTYTHTQTGSNLRPLGYPVPTAVASLTPVDGFRDYASLHARLQSLSMVSDDLSAHVVGNTHAGREVWAYVLGTASAQDREGRAKPAFFINATTHAREWAAPEVAVGLIERMMDGAGDEGLVRYLLDNTRLVIIPVQNVDGLLQTQRYPTQVVVGQDPTVPQDWPRDGRMRRKNMRGVDENLTTFADHLLGVDLNRNHSPFWGSAGHGSDLTTPTNLIYRGPGMQSEPEVRALLAAAELAPATRLRLGIDVHSFSRVFYSSNTGRARLNAIQSRLLSMLSAHHLLVPTAAGTPNLKQYADVPDPPNQGIGTASEYFAYAWLVPAWTLELEPGSLGAREYGGTADSHGGFVLPANEIRRVREAWAESHLMAFYFMAGPPHLSRVRFEAAQSGVLVAQQGWQYDPTTQKRHRVTSESTVVLPAGTRLRADLVFNKPMRHIVDGVARGAPGSNIEPLPRVRLLRGEAVHLLDTSEGSWLLRRQAYHGDTFSFEFVVPDGEGEFTLEVATTDMLGLALDAAPETPVDWVSGAWSGWNADSSSSADGDLGGRDASLRVQVAQSPVSAPRVLTEPGHWLGEGDMATVRLVLDAPVTEPVQVQTVSAEPSARVFSVAWAAGETGERVLRFPAPENVMVEGDRLWSQDTNLRFGDAGALWPFRRFEFKVLDNDQSDASIVRVSDGELERGLSLLSSSAKPVRQLVLDRGDYRGPDATEQGCDALRIAAPLRVYGNHAVLRPGNHACNALRVSGEGAVELFDLQIDARRPDGTRSNGVIGTDANLHLARSRITHATAPAIQHQGRLRLTRSAVIDTRYSLAPEHSQVVRVDGRLEALTSSVIDAWPETSYDPAGAVFRLSGAEESAFESVTILRDLMDSKIIGPASVRSTWSVQSHSPLANKRSSVPPICRDVRSLGFNVFERACFDPLASDVLDQSIYDIQLDGTERSHASPQGPAIDIGGECSPIDQRGAPRPQSLDPDLAPRCDAGAVELGVNPYRGIWQPERSGHGVDLQTAGNVLMLAWYTYDDRGEPTAYLAAAPLTGPRWRTELLQSRRDPVSGAFLAPVRVGEVGLDFDSDVRAQLSWKFDHRASGGSEWIDAFVFAMGEPRVSVTGHWFPPAESGYGASITRQGDITAVVFYYYDASGTLRWMLGTGNGADADQIDMRSYTGFCPDCDAQTMPVTSQAAGELLYHFLTPERARLDMDLRYPGVNGGLWQRERVMFMPLNDPVDNRDTLNASR